MFLSVRVRTEEKKRIFKQDFQKDRKSSAQLKNVFASLEEVGI